MPNLPYPVLLVLGFFIKMLVVMRCYGVDCWPQRLPDSPDNL